MRFVEPIKAQERTYRKWVKARPPNVRAIAEQFEPWSLYRLKETGQRVTVDAFDEEADGSVSLRVSVRAEFNLVMFERQVFGIKPEELEPCDLPKPEEATGAMLTSEQVEDNIDELRVMARPDLWVLDPKTGKAVRKQ